MKISYNALIILAINSGIIVLGDSASAQQYKVRQVTTMMGMKSESTIYVKGMRKRTEGGGYAGMPNNLVTIEQCDLRRTVTLNDKKKLYYIEPFSKETEEVIYEDEKPSAKSKPVATPTRPASTKGGVVTMWYNITDTGERKNMYGLTARHIWTTQKIKPSPDACMKDSLLMKTDGWYIDLPQFNCPVRYTAANTTMPSAIDCKDRFVTRQSGKGKLGFPLIEKRTMIMGNGLSETNQFEITIETLEFSTTKLDSMLFEIPPGYTLAKKFEELQDRMDAASIGELFKNRNKEENNTTVNSEGSRSAGMVRIGVFEPSGIEGSHTTELQSHLVSTLTGGKVEAVAVTSEEQAKKYGCNFILTSQFINVKQASKIGGLLKAVKNADPSSASSYNIEAHLSLSNLSDGSIRSEKNISGKFEGTVDGAAKKALEEGSRLLLKEIK